MRCAHTAGRFIDIAKAAPIATAAIAVTGGLAGVGIYYGLRAYHRDELRKTASQATSSIASAAKAPMRIAGRMFGNGQAKPAANDPHHPQTGSKAA